MTSAVSMSAATDARADRVEIALHELAVAAALRVLAAPDRGDVIALERHAQLADVLGGEAGQRHGQVEPHADLAAAVVLELVELLVGFVAPLAGEDFQVLQRRRVDRAEAERAIDLLGRGDQPLARDHRLGQIVAKAFERAGFDHASPPSSDQRSRFPTDSANSKVRKLKDRKMGGQVLPAFPSFCPGYFCLEGPLISCDAESSTACGVSSGPTCGVPGPSS